MTLLSQRTSATIYHSEDFVELVMEKALAMEQLANMDSQVRRHIHEAEEE